MTCPCIVEIHTDIKYPGFVSPSGSRALHFKNGKNYVNTTKTPARAQKIRDLAGNSKEKPISMTNR
jgi:hypothetical protein